MSLINDTLKHFFLKEYAHTEANKFVHLHQTGWKFDDAMFTSPAPDENGDPFISDAIAGALLSGQCDRVIPIPDSENMHLTGSTLSDTYASILYNMINAGGQPEEAFNKTKQDAITIFEDDTPVHIISELNTVSYKTFFTEPYKWYEDNGWQDPAYKEEFTLKNEDAATGPHPEIIKPVWKTSAALASFIRESRTATDITPVSRDHAAHAAGAGRPIVVDHRTHMAPPVRTEAPDHTIIRDHRQIKGGSFHVSPLIGRLAMQDKIIRKPENVTVKTVEASSISISFFYKILPVKIPWLHLQLFGDIENRWQLPLMGTGQLSTGENNISNTGSMPAYVSDVIIVKDVRISGKFSADETEQINGAFGFEAFNMLDKQIPQPGPDGMVVIEDKGRQVLGFLCTVLPESPAYTTSI